MKKTPEDIIILQMCIINDSHMMYYNVLFLRYGVQQTDFFVIWTVFLPSHLSPLHPHHVTT